MDPIQKGARISNMKLRTLVDGAFTDVNTDTLFRGKKVVLFGLPGAFTPTCSTSHVPRFEELYDLIQATGVHEVICTSVNDVFVMNSWRQAQGVSKVQFLADGNGTLAKGLGLLVDKSDLGFGKRSWRYSMVIDDGVVVKTFIEPQKPGDPYEVSDADTMLAYLGGEAPPNILLFTKPGCPHCKEAKQALFERGLPFSEVEVSTGQLRALPGANTTPQVFVDGAHLGDKEALLAWLSKK